MGTEQIQEMRICPLRSVLVSDGASGNQTEARMFKSRISGSSKIELLQTTDLRGYPLEAAFATA